METDVLFDQQSHLGLICLNRPQALHALTLDMVMAIDAQLSQWQTDPAIKAVIIQASPAKAFCAGGDVRWLYDRGRAEDPQQLDFFHHEYRMNLRIQQLGKPYIALMDGLTMGGGVGVSLHGSHPIASPRFVFAMPETSIGFFPDIGASHLLARCPQATGCYLGLTGNRLNAWEAQAFGLVRGVMAAEDFPQLISALLDADLDQHPHAAVDACLAQISAVSGPGPIEQHLDCINACFAAPRVEDILAKLAEAGSDWAAETRQLLLQKAPLSLKVTRAQLAKAAGLSLADCLAMDARLVRHFMQGHDFYEGVRALLVDKDKNPQWQPDRLEAVTEAMVEGYFI